MNNKEKLNALLSYFGLNATQFAASLGYASPNKIYDLLRGKTRTMSEDLTGRIISNYPQIRKAWLLADEGEMLVRAEPTPHSIPLINVDSVGGMEGQNSLTDLPHAVERVVPMVDSLPGDIAIYHTGQSMLPNIPPGSLLHLRPLPQWQEFFGYGGVFVLELTDGRRITKQVMGSQLDLKTHVRCVSFNPDYPDEELPRSMILHVWRVVHCLTSL